MTLDDSAVPIETKEKHFAVEVRLVWKSPSRLSISYPACEGLQARGSPSRNIDRVRYV